MIILYLCEKPSQARTLARVLGANTKEDGAYTGSGVCVTYGFGHLLGMATPDAYLGHKEWNISDLPILPKEWKLLPTKSGATQLELIGQWLSKASMVVIATDPDDEGEIIGRRILDWHKYKGPVKRMWPSALDQDSISKALNDLRPIEATDHIYRAGIARHMMDWLIGMNMSRLFTMKLGFTARIGRVKTILMHKIASREASIAQFKPEQYYHGEVVIDGDLFAWSGDVGRRRPQFGNLGVCIEMIDETSTIKPPPPYTLSALLIDAAARGVCLADGYAAAQTLYLSGAISYPRTSSSSLPGTSAGFAAHHAILPTDSGWSCPDSMGEAARVIYELVRLNWVLQNIGPALINVRRTTYDFNGHSFVNEKRWIENEFNAGWMICTPDYDGLNMGKPHISHRQSGYTDLVPALSSRTTSHPPLFDEASILTMMVRSGLGTEATRVDAIQGLVRDGVVTFENGFCLTDYGRQLDKSLPSAVKGQDMERLVKTAVEKMRNGAPAATINRELENAANWVFQFVGA